MTTYPVEHGIPIPEVDKYRGGRTPTGLNYPFSSMRVGDSFFVPAASRDRSGTLCRVMMAARKYAAKQLADGFHLMEFTCRTLVDEETGNLSGVRCWRTT